MSRILVILTVLVLVLTTVVIVRGAKDSYEVLPANLNQPLTIKPFEDWRPFNSIAGDFAVELPVLPQHAKESITDPATHEIRKYDMYIAEKIDGSIFMISLITYPNVDAVSGDILMDTVIKDMMAANPSNVLKERKEFNFDSRKAIDFSIQNTDVNIDGREFVGGNTLYLLTYIAKKSNYERGEFEHFVKSFVLKGEKK